MKAPRWCLFYPQNMATLALSSSLAKRASAPRESIAPRRAHVRASVVASASSKPAVVVLPGLGNCTEDYDEFASELELRGFSATVAAVGRPDWLRNAAGLTQLAYWQGTLEPRPTVDWYLSRIADAVAAAKEKSGADRVALVAHSAGGWMSRVYMQDFGVDDIRCVVTLGSPLNAVPKDVPGVVDQTRGILTYVEANCAKPTELGVPVTCLAGKWLLGVETLGGAGDAAGFLVGQGYKQVCGSAAAWGDGITPVATAHLDGADNVTLEGCAPHPSSSFFARPSPRVPILAHRLFPPFARSQGIPHADRVVRRAAVVRHPKGARPVGGQAVGGVSISFWLEKYFFLCYSLRARLCCLCSPRTTRGSKSCASSRAPVALHDRDRASGPKPGRIAPRLSRRPLPLAKKDRPMLA